ncbi:MULTISPECIES: ISNCY family transposase [unclassified Treponema]|uniref:ISNCY family transposase n=1 Tax=unclassified Treponema TaxID=2638727 RepID=UPI0020A2F895|nr:MULTISPECIES: ISNCY family transposase [unclassified Treponema]UTC66031.1 ISNCY family transposase [Treponema sp. OMZ 789]UTC68761.1 ISNCY family transposase [Treponema sp. OMZ 790]UTC71490.1 ISNCY family transposase [Treponema sp. OMZ 791]
MNYELQKLKMLYIPMFARGEITERECARLCRIQPVSVWRLKKRYLAFGDAAFIHGNTGRKPKNKIYDYEKIAADYKKFEGTPFMAFRDDCADYLNYTILPCYTTFYTVLSSAGIVSPRARIPVREKKKHLPRPERPNEGDLVQVDASRHDWFLNGHKVTLHGAIDDATHEIVALYFCENECLLGYNELIKQILARKGGLPRAIYTDRAAIFFVSRGATLEEQLAGAEKTSTQWQKMCKELNIELIAAYSPQAKGRIERLWQTLQGRLPYIFRFQGINTIEAANEFLADFIDGFNARFSVPAQDPALHWKAPQPSLDFHFLFSVKAEKKTKADGSFIYHGYKFRLLANRAACVRFTLCLSESYGLRGYMNGKYYDVELCEPLCDVVGDSMPLVEKNLIYRYLLADTHSGGILLSG